MCAGGDGDGFGLGLAAAVRVRERQILRPAPGRKNEEATAQEQKAVLIDVFHERIVARATGREADVCDTFGGATLTKGQTGLGEGPPPPVRSSSRGGGHLGCMYVLRK